MHVYLVLLLLCLLAFSGGEAFAGCLNSRLEITEKYDKAPTCMHSLQHDAHSIFTFTDKTLSETSTKAWKVI